MRDNTGENPALSAVNAPRIALKRADVSDEAHFLPAGPEISIIVPTYNERANVLELVRRLRKCLASHHWEVIFVDDDSPDETAQFVRELGRQDKRVRCIQRIGRRGLSSACIEGMLASSAPYLVVIDGDLQHDERQIPRMLAELKEKETDFAIGSRYVREGGFGDWDESRIAISALATRLSRLVLKADLSDPMSGFFVLRREAMERSVRKLSGMGFKILVDLFASTPTPPTFVEVPYQFQPRAAGKSKLDTHAVWDYVMLLLDKLVGHLIPIRFVAFCLVGGLGVFVHFTVLAVLFQLVGVSFLYSQAVATLVAITGNFTLNNVLTYRDKQLKGVKWLQGLASFSLACGVGAFANVGIASYLFSVDTKWFLAALGGILVGTVWNYSVTQFYTWKAP